MWQICHVNTWQFTKKKRLPHHSAASPLFHHSNVMGKYRKIWENDVVDAVDVASMGVRKMKNTHCEKLLKNTFRDMSFVTTLRLGRPATCCWAVEHEEGSNFRTFQTSKSKQYIWYSTFAFGWICDQCIDIIVVPDLKRTKLNNWSYMGFK